MGLGMSLPIFLGCNERTNINPSSFFKKKKKFANMLISQAWF